MRIKTVCARFVNKITYICTLKPNIVKSTFNPMRYFLHIITLFLIATFTLAMLSSCNNNAQQNDDNNTVQPLPAAPPAEVTTVPLTTVDFEHELVSNGRISARMVAEVRFQTSEIITEIFVRNGDRVATYHARYPQWRRSVSVSRWEEDISQEHLFIKNTLMHIKNTKYFFQNLNITITPLANFYMSSKDYFSNPTVFSNLQSRIC